MTPRSELPRLSYAAWSAIYPAVERLRRTGHPDTLAATARALEAHPDLDGAGDAAVTVRRLEQSARAQLVGLKAVGIEYDFETGMAKLPTGGRRGGGGKVINRVIGAAFDELGLSARETHYTPDIYQAVRDKLALLIDPADVDAIPDTTIKGAIERRPRRR